MITKKKMIKELKQKGYFDAETYDIVEIMSLYKYEVEK